METTLNYIKTLTSIPSPTGFTQTIMTYIIKELEAFGYSPISTNKGGVMVSLKGKNDTKHRMIT
ncbi:peptidase M42, partial [Staphylococcus aureus]